MEEEAIIYNRLLQTKKDVEDIIEKVETLGYKTDWLKTARNTLQMEADYIKKDFLSRI